MMMTSDCERLLEVSSRPWDRTRRSCVIRIVTVDSAGFSSQIRQQQQFSSVQKNFRSNRRVLR